MASNGLEHHASLMREWLSMAGVEKSEIRSLVAQHLVNKVREHFDSKTLDSLEEEPAWLDETHGITSDGRFRTLLYELCVANPECALLKAVVQKLQHGEHAAEVAAHTGLSALVGSASSLDTFVASLALQLKARLDGHAGAQAALDGIACAGEVQLLCALLLVQSGSLADEPGHAEVLEEVAAQMAEAAARSHGQPARRLQLLAAGVPRHSALMSCLISVLTAGAISSADAHHLLEQCQGGAASTACVALRQPALLLLLLTALFDPARPPKPAPRDMLLRVLARVAVAAGGGVATAGAEAGAEADAGAAAEAGAGAAAGAAGGAVDGSDAAAAADGATSSTRAAFERALTALREAQAICESNEVSEIRASVAALSQYVVEPAAACGVLLWAQTNLTNPAYSGSRYNMTYVPGVLRLLSTVSSAHPSLHGALCMMLHECLVHEPATDSSDISGLGTIEVRRLLHDTHTYRYAHMHTDMHTCNQICTHAYRFAGCSSIACCCSSLAALSYLSSRRLLAG